MLSFLSPLFLIGSAAAAVPIVLHLLKREPEARVKFAAVKMLRDAPVEDTKKHRLRELLLLALRVAALVLLALAFARPFFATGAAVGRTTATMIALDTSYSMSAPGRFAHAQQLARDAISRAPAGELVGVLTFADRADVIARPSTDRVATLSAVDHAAPGFGATRYRSALSAAAQALAGRSGTIVVVTDLQEIGWDAGDRAAIPADARVEIADVGAPPANLTVTAVRPINDRVVATIRNAAPGARDVRAHLTVDGRRAGDAAVAIGPNQSADVVFAGVRGIEAAVSVDDPDGLAADNTRYAVLSGSSRPSVLVVGGSGNLSRDAFYVQHALAAAAPGDRGYAIAGTSGAELSTIDAARLADQAAIVVVSTRGLERRGREALASYMRAGGGLLIAAGPDVDGDVAADLAGTSTALQIAPVAGQPPMLRTLAPADARHPIFRPFAGGATLALVRFQTAARIAGAGCQTLARFTTGDSAMIECAADDGRVMVLASDLDNRWNDFPLHASFVPFLHESVRYLASAKARVSEYLVGDEAAGIPATPGVHVISTGNTARHVAVNVDPREGDPSRMSADEFLSAVTHVSESAPETRVEARQQEDDQHLWRYALALMVIALAVEGLIASRTA